MFVLSLNRDGDDNRDFLDICAYIYKIRLKYRIDIYNVIRK
jgi:hypothetical protein